MARIARLPLLALAASALALGVAAPVASADTDAAADDFFALNVQDVFHKWGNDPATRASLFSQATAAGFGSGRLDALWNLVQPTSAAQTPDWGATDSMARELARAGMRWKPIFDTTPKWASGSSNIYAPPTTANLPAFAKF